MNSENFEKGFMTLVAAKLLAPDPNFIKAKRDVYWIRLREIPDDLWFNAIGYCLDHGIFFPSIEELGEAAAGKENCEKVVWTYPERIVKKVPWEEALGIKKEYNIPANELKQIVDKVTSDT